MEQAHIALSQFQLKDLTLQNRAVVAPMSRVSTLGDGVPTELMKDYYARFASGGFGLIITEGTYTDRHYAQAYPNQPGITNAIQRDGWARIAEATNQIGAPMIMQLMHAGALSQHLSATRSASAIPPVRHMLPGYSKKQGRYPTPQAMTLADMDMVKEGYIQASRHARQAGFAGVEIHGANGYLFDQFLTDYSNNREDQYGGTTENRVRFLAEVIGLVRSEMDDEFIVGVRVSQGKVNDFDYLWPSGVKDGEIIFKAAHQAGADYIHFASEGLGFDHGCLTRDGQSLPAFARRITGLPVIANGGLDDFKEAERILSNQHGDLISLGKGALANPDWPEKLAQSLAPLPFEANYFAQGVAIQAA